MFNSVGTQAGNRFNDWAELVEAVNAIAVASRIVFERSETIPRGEWDLNGATLWGNGIYGGEYGAAWLPGDAGGVTVTFGDGATITNPGATLAQFGILLYSVSSSPVLRMDRPGGIYLADDALMASRSAPFLEVTADEGMCFVSLRTGGGIVKPSTVGIRDGDHESVAVTGTPSIFFIADAGGSSRLDDDVIRGTGAGARVILSAGADVVAGGAKQSRMGSWSVKYELTIPAEIVAMDEEAPTEQHVAVMPDFVAPSGAPAITAEFPPIIDTGGGAQIDRLRYSPGATFTMNVLTRTAAPGVTVCGRVVALDSARPVGAEACADPIIPDGLDGFQERLAIPFIPIDGDHRYGLQMRSSTAGAATSSQTLDVLVRW